jgi:non-specific protein-tyrosine kinase
MVGQIIHQANPTGQDFYTIERLAESYAQIAVRQPILQAVIDSLGLEMSWQGLRGRVHAAPIPRTQLLAVRVQDTSPERAVVLADEIAHQLIVQSPGSPDNQARQERSQFVQGQLDDLEERIGNAQARVKDLEAELDSAFSARQIQDLQTEIAGLETLINNWQANYSDLLNFLEGGNDPNYLTIIEPAQEPRVPISPNVRTNVLLAAAVGFALALGAALLLEYIDDTIRSSEDLGASHDLTVLGGISRMPGKGYKDKLIVSHGPTSPTVEAYRLVRTNIQVADGHTPTTSILVTSPGTGEGKSITAANLGVVMAQADLRTIIVDSDLRIPRMHKIFRVPNSEGLTDLLRSPGLEVGDYLQDTGTENLRVITSGPLPTNSSEMLGSARMDELVQRLEKLADVIIFDSPPVLAVADAAVLSQRVDGVVLVLDAGRTHRAAARHAAERLRSLGANILGTVLNRVSGRDAAYHYYYSHYTYSSTRGSPGKGPNPDSAPGDSARQH